MIENRELSMDDYLAMLRRRAKVILFPAVLAPLAGFLVSFSFPAKYTSQSVVVVEEQKVPDAYVKPMITEDVMQRAEAIRQRVLSTDLLEPAVQRLGLAKRGRSLDEVVETTRQNLTVGPLVPETAVTLGKKKSGDVVGFSVTYMADNPNDAQAVCSQLTTMMLDQNYQHRRDIAKSATEFFTKQLDQAQNDMNDKGAKLADFKKQHIGQLPVDAENNLKILGALNSQLDSNTQTLNRAQQDRAYAESVLAQQLAAWKASQSSTDPQTLQKQLASLESQLITLQARYTDDHPDVVKTKNDIVELKRKLKEINGATPQAGDTGDKANAAEPPEVRQLRLQIHQYDGAITQATADQKRLQGQIDAFQRRVAISPDVEAQYNQLNADYLGAQKAYNDLKSKQSDLEMQTDMEAQQKGELMRLVIPASLPDKPDFPNRWLFAGGGLGAGLAVGFGIAMWLELRDKSIRTEQDVMAVLDLPMLASVPWVGTEAAQKNGGGHWYGRKAADQEKPETAKV